MNDYERYYQKGGTYVIPVEVLNNLIEENQQLKKDYNKVVHESTEFESEVYELQNKIDKAIEYVNHPWKFKCSDEDCNLLVTNRKRFLLEILKGVDYE